MDIGMRLTGAMARLPLEENAQWAAEHGFRDIETGLTDDLVEKLRPSGISAWAAAMRGRLMTADDAERETAITQAKASIDSAARQGIKVLCCSHPMVEGKPGADQINVL